MTRASLTKYFTKETDNSYHVLSFKYSGIVHNVVEMPSHDINTSVQWLLFKADNGPFSTESSGVRHNIRVSVHH